MWDKGQLRQAMVTFAATLGGIPVGLALAYTGSAIPQWQHAPLGLSDLEVAVAGAAMPFGAMLAGPLAGWCLSKLGRRLTMAVAAIPAGAGWVLLGVGATLAALIPGRLLTGVAVGFATVVGPMYVGEVSDAKVRGIMGAVFEFQLTLGLLISFVAGKYLTWQWQALVSGSFSAAWLLSVIIVVESPVWLVDKGRMENARKVLSWLRAVDDGAEDSNVNEELTRLQDESEMRRVQQSTYRDLLRPQNRHAFGISVLCLALQQLCGINAVTFYATPIFQETGDALDSTTAPIIMATTQLIGMIIGVAVIHYVGRRILLIGSSLTIALSNIALGVFFHLKDGSYDVSNITWLPLLAIVVFVFAFSIGMGPVPFLIMGEVFSDEVRGVGSGVSIFANWACAVLVTVTFSPLVNAITNAGVFWVFAILCVMGAVALYFTLTETKGKTLAQIQRELRGELPTESDLTSPVEEK